MAMMVSEVKAKGATAIICFAHPAQAALGNPERDFVNIASWDQQVASNTGSLFFDLTLVVTAAYKKAGHDTVETYFCRQGHAYHGYRRATERLLRHRRAQKLARRSVCSLLFRQGQRRGAIPT